VTARVRVARPDDAGRFLEIYGPIVRETAISFEEAVPSLEEMQSRITGTLPSLPWLTLTESDPEGTEVVLGYACAGAHRKRASYRWSVEVGIYLDPQARGRGWGKSLYRVLLEVVGAQGYLNALGGVGLPNAGSVALHESLGFERIATYKDVGFKHGAWHDVGWWQLRLAPLPEQPPEPRAFADLLAELDFPREL
jgi:L-amino acid N-acyltransferase YncA